jgi:hypothetical protein
MAKQGRESYLELDIINLLVMNLQQSSQNRELSLLSSFCITGEHVCLCSGV